METKGLHNISSYPIDSVTADELENEIAQICTNKNQDDNIMRDFDNKFSSLIGEFSETKLDNHKIESKPAPREFVKPKLSMNDVIGGDPGRNDHHDYSRQVHNQSLADVSTDGDDSGSESASASSSESSTSGSSYKHRSRHDYSKSNSKGKHKMKYQVNERILDQSLNKMQSYTPTPGHVNPLEQMSKEQMISEIDIYTQVLRDIQYSGEIPTINENMSHFEIYRAYSLLKRIYNQQSYADTFEDMYLLLGISLEAVFDGNMKVFGRFPIDYTDLEKTLRMKYNRHKTNISHMVSSVADRYGIDPHSLLMFDLMSPLITVPFKNRRKKNVSIKNPSTLEGINN
jgi:hypothetical protein